MNSKELLSIIDNIHISGKIVYPHRIEGVNNTDDPIQKYHDQIAEIGEIRINGMYQEKFYQSLKNIAEEVILDIYRTLQTCENRDRAIMLMEQNIDDINVYQKEKYNVSAEVVKLKDRHRGILHDDWDASNDIPTEMLYWIEEKIWNEVNAFVYNKILSRSVERLSADCQRLRKTRLPTFKSNLMTILPEPVSLKPTLQGNRFSFELNSEIVGTGAIANYKIEKVGEFLADIGIFIHTQDLTTLLKTIFNNKPVSKKVKLSNNCDKGFFRVLLNNLKHKEIILNRDYFKAATVCFEFDEDPNYNLVKLKKTTPIKNAELLAVVEKCIEIFCNGRP